MITYSSWAEWNRTLGESERRVSDPIIHPLSVSDLCQQRGGLGTLLPGYSCGARRNFESRSIFPSFSETHYSSSQALSEGCHTHQST